MDSIPLVRFKPATQTPSFSFIAGYDHENILSYQFFFLGCLLHQLLVLAATMGPLVERCSLLKLNMISLILQTDLHLGLAMGIAADA
jgi:hypothetical protein